MKLGLRVGLKNWTTLLCFEIFYKIIGFSLLLTFADEVKRTVLQVNGISYIGQENIKVVFANPTSLLLLFCLVLLVVYYIYLEIVALILYCEAGWQDKPLSLWGLWNQAVLRALPIFHYKNFPVLLLLLPMIAFAVFPMTDGLLSNAQIPEFIADYIQGDPRLYLAAAIGLVLLNLLLFFYLFSFPAVILQGSYFWGSLRSSMKLLEGRKMRTLIHLVVRIVAFLLFVTLGFWGFILLLWAWCRWAQPLDGGRSMFQFYYLKWSGVGRLLANALGPAILAAFAVIHYHLYRGEKPPQPSDIQQKSKVSALLGRAATVCFTVVLLLMFSETELGGNLPFFTGPVVTIVAHRAGAAFAPENTVAALRAAIADEADMAEIDVQQTKDGVLVVLHDTSLKRTGGLDQKIWETDDAVVRSLDVGASFSERFAGERIPTLEEMLAAAKGKIYLMIELKSTGHEEGLAEETIRQIRAAGMERECLLASMNLDLLKQCKELAPEIETVYISTLLFSNYYNLPYVDNYSVEVSFLSPEMVAQIHTEGKKVYAWTVNREENIQKVLRLGADGLITDNPILARYYVNLGDQSILLEELMELLYPQQDGKVMEGPLL